MTIISGLGIVLSLVFGCLLMALVGELYYLLWWKKQRITKSPSNNNIQEDYSTHAKEMFYLFCWDKPTPIINNPDRTVHDTDIEEGLSSRKDALLTALGEESVDPDIIMLATSHPRFLFTITEETKEDLESDNGGGKSRKGSRARSLSDLIMAIEAQTPYYLSPKRNSDVESRESKMYVTKSNPLFELSSSSSVEAELKRLRSSPPPKFKFLRDAEDKLYRRLLEEAQRSGILLQEGILDEQKDGFCTSQVHSLASNCDVLPRNSV